PAARGCRAVHELGLRRESSRRARARGGEGSRRRGLAADSLRQTRDQLSGPHTPPPHGAVHAGSQVTMRSELPPESQSGTSSEAHGSLEELAARAVRVIAVTIVDNAGVARVKAVPMAAYERSLRNGLGLSPIFNVCTVVDTFTRSAAVGGPTGDLRLIPDPAAARLCAEPGWAIAPADQYTQDGEVFGCCQRSFARRMVQEAFARRLEL